MPLDFQIIETVELRYDPNQPRDKDGQWSGSRGGGTIEGQARSNRLTVTPKYSNENYGAAARVKHEGSLRIAAEMTPAERKTLRADLDYSVQDSSMASTEPFSHIVAMAQANVWSVHGMTVGLASQLNGIYDRYQDDYKLMDRVTAELASFEKDGDRVGIVGRLEKMTGVSPESGFVSYMNQQWAQDATGVESMAMHLTVADKFNLADAREALRGAHEGSFSNGPYAQAKGLAKTRAAALTVVADATYRTTQKFLREQGDEEVTLVRGVKGRNPAKIMAQPFPLSSWSTDTGTALGFGEDVYRSVFTPDRIYSIAAITGNGSLQEQEMVVIGRPVVAEEIGHSEDFAAADLPVVSIDAGDGANWIKHAKGKALTAAFDPTQPRDKDGQWATTGRRGVTMIRGDIQRERKAILRELDAQGLDELNPLRHIFESSMGNHVAVIRSDAGEVVGGVQFDVDRSGRSVDVTDMRVLPKKQGYGTEAFTEIAKMAVEHDYDLSVRSALESAKPFYQKLGAHFQTGHSDGHWTDEGRDALAKGTPTEGSNTSYDEWINLPLWQAATRPRRRKPVIIASVLTGDDVVCYNGSFEIKRDEYAGMEPADDDDNPDYDWTWVHERNAKWLAEYRQGEES